MVSSALSRAVRTVTVLIAFSLPTLPAQQASQPPGETPVLLATPRYLFVLRGDVLYQFDVDTLALRHRTRLSAGAPRAEMVDIAEEVVVEEVVPEDVVVEVVAEDIAARPWRINLALSSIVTKRAVSGGLEWLSRHQDDDGKWDCDQFMKHDRADGAICDGPGNAVHDVGVTSLAMLALLASGSTMRAGPYRDNIKAGARWLRSQQQNNGLFGSNAPHDFIYDHAIATWAMSEAYGLSNYKMLRSSVQKGINYLESHRNPYAVWRYQPLDNDNDISVTNWCVRAYVSAKSFGLDVNENALKYCATFFDQVTDPSGHHGYSKQGEPSSRHPGDHATRFPVARTEALTAAGLYSRFLLGQQPADVPVMRAAANRLVAKQPKWDPQTGSIDHYYWLQGSMALRRMGGRHWQLWSRALVSATTGNQRTDGNFAGSWDPVGVWGDDGGRVYATAVLSLALQQVVPSAPSVEK